MALKFCTNLIKIKLLPSEFYSCRTVAFFLSSQLFKTDELQFCCYIRITSTLSMPVGRNFQRGVRSIRQKVWGPLKAPRSPWVFGAKSCNLHVAISRHFIQTFGKPCSPLLIFKDFHQILQNVDFDSVY